MMNAKFKRLTDWGWRVIKGFLDNNCSLHAAGLTYFSMLALVPILCILLLAAKYCGADDYVKRFVNRQIDSLIVNIEQGQDDDIAALTVANEEALQERKRVAEELGQQAREIRDGVFERIDKFDVGTLGWVGFALLLWTVISSIGMVEVSFNEIWQVAKPRPIWKRACLYLAVVIIVPVFAALAMSVPILKIAKDLIVRTAGAADVTRCLSDGLCWFLDSTLLRLVIILAFASLAFAYLFWALPNCRVNFRYAWRGGLITAFLFGAWMKICSVAQVGIAKSSALYGSFAFFPIVLAWLYMSWQIVLLGANMVCAFHPEEKK